MRVVRSRTSAEIQLFSAAFFKLWEVFFGYMDSKKLTLFELRYPVNVEPCGGRDRFSGKNLDRGPKKNWEPLA